MSNLLETKGLTKVYNNVIALNNVNLTIEKGRIIGLLGPNGSGKTTFIKLLTGLLSPTEGTVTIAGYSIGPETKSSVSYLSDTQS